MKKGEKFVMKENGFGKVVGSIKEMIIRGGEKILKKEIEKVMEKK
jgi:non-ribosomal peptide synthetase component E (peptide arylation enzyme)